MGGNSTVSVGADNKTAKVTVDGAQLVAKGDLTAKTTGNIDVKSGAKVASDKTLKFETTGDGSSVTIKDGAKVLAAEDIDIDATGAVTVDNATVAAKGDVLVGDATTRAGSFTAQKGATVAADAGSVSVYAKGDATVDGGTTAVTANNGDVTIDANGNIEVKGATVTATGGDATLTAGKDDSTDNGRIDISGTVAATATDDQDPKGGNATLTAKGADVADDPAKSAVEITGSVTADQKATINATIGSVDVKGGTVTAGETASVTAAQNATVETGATVTGADVAIKATAAKATVAGDVEATTATASVTAGTDTEVSGNVTGDNVMLEAKTGVVLSGSASVTTTGSVDDGNGNLRIHTEDGGITLGAGTTVSTANNVTVLADNGDITQDTDITATAGTIDVEAANGSIVMADGTTSKTVQNGNIRYKTGTEITLSKIDAGTGSVTLDALGDLVAGSLDSKVIADGLAVKANKVGKSNAKMQFSVSKLAVNSATDVYVDNDKSVTVIDAKGNDFKVNRINADGTLGSVQSDDINGVVAENGDVDLDVTSGILTIDTKVSAATTANMAGDGISFDVDGNVSGATVVLTAKSGDITQSDATISATGGYVPETPVNAAVTTTGKATLVAANGSIGSVKSGSADYVGVEAGSVAANAAKDVAIADPNGNGLVVDSDGIKGGSAVAVHTAGTIAGDGTISAPRLTVSAKSYENGIVKVNVGNTLTVNNFTGGMNPLLAIFEANGGSDRPNLENLPNKTVVFYNGRLLGGDIKIINTLGAIEAFPVQTPELKSEQGIFGNPVFLHDELDVANPLAVGAIDFLLLDIPRLTLSSDFPLEVEKQVAAAGLNPTTSYWFGQKSNEAEGKEEDSDGKPSDVKGGDDTPTAENQTAMN